MPDPGTELRRPLPDGRLLGAREQAGQLELWLDGENVGCFELACEGSQTLLASQHPPESTFPLWAASYSLFTRSPPCHEIVWSLPAVPAGAVDHGLVQAAGNGWLTSRERFWQLPQPWLPATATKPPREQSSLPAKPVGEIYRRFDSRLGQQISFRTVDIEGDLERFNTWQNKSRVLQFWQEGGTPAQHRDYLARIATDPHIFSAIGCFDDQPFGYFELYWAKEDRIAPFYAVGDHDRGLHMLVGEERHRGPHKVASWLTALVHYLLVDDQRTRTLVAEPRADNTKMIDYMKQCGFVKEKEFDFPHKRAALMKLTRDTFFGISRFS